jgi:hypothetical protein
VALQAPAISILNKGEGNTANGVKVFSAALISIGEFLGLEWSKSQFQQVASLMFSAYHYWTLAELKHFLLKTKLGDFGKVYGKFSPAMLMEYAGTYNDELLEARASYKPIQPETPKDGCVPSEVVSDTLNGFISQWEVELSEKERIEAEREKEQRARDLAAYARLMGINLEEVEADLNKDNQNTAA